ncbi:3'-5' exonuclease [Lichenihabitans sp. Uapishka_5]|uniref:3'-5' exonuclease n=1 Tax=Lichenihabitans sp. Uapishka_5 TaxID=3037302 RepID=UPI0029E800D6|nr:3'-5' exonuclease [Lichenihabitans sp. Uapishka_5]MDX7953994.1 3'-5' exonuclease [Lichenihabitans sp. Uapishka_5]
MPWQADLFDRPGPDSADDGSTQRLPAARRSSKGSRVITPKAAAKVLEASDDYRVLRRLRPREIVSPRLLGPGERLAIVIDTETTGLDHRDHEVIELGMVAFVHDAEGTLLAVTGEFSALQEPSGPLEPEITRLTGITDAMLTGQRIDLDAVEAFIEQADLVIAHNAGFDRPFCERLARGFEPKPWACSVKEVDWAGFGFEGTKLGYLVGQAGWFHNGHRATDDCHALLEVLAATLPGQDGSAVGHLLTRSETPHVRIWAEGAPYDLKDQLKSRGYRWSDGSDGRPRAWWVEVDEASAETEIAYLEGEIYMRRVRPRAQRITACERYKKP